MFGKIGRWAQNKVSAARQWCSEKAAVVRTCVAGGVAVGGTVAAQAQTAPETDYATTLTSNLTTIDTIWGKVAVIMIGVALVTVGVRFFRKAK